MNAKVTIVKVTNGVRVDAYPLDHAERLLAFRGGGWSLADERYELREGKLVRKKKGHADDRPDTE